MLPFRWVIEIAALVHPGPQMRYFRLVGVLPLRASRVQQDGFVESPAGLQRGDALILDESSLGFRYLGQSCNPANLPRVLLIYLESFAFGGHRDPLMAVSVAVAKERGAAPRLQEEKVGPLDSGHDGRPPSPIAPAHSNKSSGPGWFRRLLPVRCPAASLLSAPVRASLLRPARQDSQLHH